MIIKNKKREEINDKYKWDLSTMYKSDKDIELDINKLNILLTELLTYKDKIMSSSTNLLAVLQKEEQLDRILSNLYVYASMKYHEDTAIETAIKLKGRMEKIYVEASEKLVFITTEILKSDYQLVKEYLNKEPNLRLYKFKLERLFRGKPHILSDSEETLLAATSEIFSSSSNIYEVISNTDIKYDTVNIDNKEIEITNSNFVTLLNTNKQEDRKKVFETYYQSLNKFKNTFASTLKYSVKTYSLIARLRQYESPLHMSLYHNNIDVSVVNNLIEVVNKNLLPLHNYIKLRKQELGLKELHMYDIYVNMVSKSKQEYTYEEAFSMIREALKPLGEDYIKLLDKAYHERWIDVYENENKRSGAYSSGTYDSNPYILTNFDGTLNEVYTLAHELGHSMHSYYSNKSQPYAYSNYSLFTAEVTSLVNEILLSNYLLNKATNKNEKKIILNQLMEKFKGTLYRQTMFAEFELLLYDKEQNNEVLTEQLLSNLYYELNKKYYGNDIIHDKEIALEWIRIPHFYRPFYVYQYATGIAAGFSIAIDIIDGKKEAVNNYKEFLKSGDSDYPIELLKIVGIDMTKKEPIEKAIKRFESIISDYMALS
ncbi:MAG: oligoendopeptidase F [Bacilli bacterium]|nr:oligoendopeptidase F [Bacilli bacterium]